MLEKDIADNRAIGAHGAKAILDHVAETAGAAGAGPVRVLTHCNTGSLATAGYGTALGVVRHLSELGKLGKATNSAICHSKIHINTHLSLSFSLQSMFTALRPGRTTRAHDSPPTNWCMRSYPPPWCWTAWWQRCFVSKT